MFCLTCNGPSTSNPNFISAPISSAPLLTESGANASLKLQATSSAVTFPQSPPLLCQGMSGRMSNVMLVKSEEIVQLEAMPRSSGL